MSAQERIGDRYQPLIKTLVGLFVGAKKQNSPPLGIESKKNAERPTAALYSKFSHGIQGATLTRKGQTTIPKDVRKALGLRPGDRMEFIIEADGRVVLLGVNCDIRELSGILPKPRRPVSVNKIRRAVRQRNTAARKP